MTDDNQPPEPVQTFTLGAAYKATATTAGQRMSWPPSSLACTLPWGGMSEEEVEQVQ